MELKRVRGNRGGERMIYLFMLSMNGESWDMDKRFL